MITFVIRFQSLLLLLSRSRFRVLGRKRSGWLRVAGVAVVVVAEFLAEGGREGHGLWREGGGLWIRWMWVSDVEGVLRGI